MGYKPTIRESIFRAASCGGVVATPRGSELDMLWRGAPVTLSAELLAGCLALVDRPVDLSLSSHWTLTGDDVLTPSGQG